MTTGGGRRAFIAYLNQLQPAQAAAMRRAAFATMDVNGGELPPNDPRDAEAGRPVLLVDPRADRTRFPFGPWADAGAFRMAGYSIGADGTIYRTGADGTRTRVDPATDPYARLLAARRRSDSSTLQLFPEDHAFPRSQDGLMAWMAGAGLPLPRAVDAPSAPQLYAAPPGGGLLGLRVDPAIGMMPYASVSRDQPLLATGRRVPGWIEVVGRDALRGVFARGWVPDQDAEPR
jgi:hypothetical protein